MVTASGFGDGSYDFVSHSFFTDVIFDSSYFCIRTKDAGFFFMDMVRHRADMGMVHILMASTAPVSLDAHETILRDVGSLFRVGDRATKSDCYIRFELLDGDSPGLLRRDFFDFSSAAFRSLSGHLASMYCTVSSQLIFSARRNFFMLDFLSDACHRVGYL